MIFEKYFFGWNFSGRQSGLYVPGFYNWGNCWSDFEKVYLKWQANTTRGTDQHKTYHTQAWTVKKKNNKKQSAYASCCPQGITAERL